jgi:hypothetical protein
MTRAGLRAIAAIGIAAALCACSGKGGTTMGGGGGSAGGASPCEGIRARVEQLYRAEAQAKEPKRVDEAVADNTTMVMNDCARAPAKVSRCVRGVASVPELEKKCLAPLDDEGTEGEELRR